MKIRSLIIGSMILMGATLAKAGAEPLTDAQMESVTAGTHENGIDTSVAGSFDVNQDVGDIITPIGNKDLEAENVVNIVDTHGNRATEDNSVNANTIVLKDYAQKDSKAGAIVNNINGQVATGFNGQVNKDLGLSGSSPVKLNQSNIIIQK